MGIHIFKNRHHIWILYAAKKGMTMFDGPIQLVIRHTHVNATTHGILITN